MGLINRAYVRRRFREAFRATTTTQKGRILESLITYVMKKVPGVILYERNVLSITKDQEIDVAFWNNKSRGALDFLPFVIPVETKCVNSPTGADEVSRFETKMADSCCEYGVFVAAAGITGDAAELTAAHQAIKSALQRGHRILVVTRSELEGLENHSDFVTLLKRKLCMLAVRKTSLST